MTLLDPLPRTVRLRLAFDRTVDGVGVWLVRRGHHRLAELLWRACGRWH